MGAVNGVEYHRQLQAATGLSLSYDDFCFAWNNIFWADEAVLKLVVAAPVEKRYLLSNTNEIHWRFIQTHFPHLLQPFDKVVVSHEIGLEKPDPAIYQWVIRDSGYSASQHLFIDDIQSNIEGAQAVGMDTILYTNAAELWHQFAVRGLTTEKSTFS